jgi:hypothetical protein
MTVQEMYDSSIKPLPTADRLELASLILREIPRESLVDYNDTWSDEDLHDLNRQTERHIEEIDGAEGETG